MRFRERPGFSVFEVSHKYPVPVLARVFRDDYQLHFRVVFGRCGCLSLSVTFMTLYPFVQRNYICHVQNIMLGCSISYNDL